MTLIWLLLLIAAMWIFGETLDSIVRERLPVDIPGVSLLILFGFGWLGWMHIKFAQAIDRLTNRVDELAENYSDANRYAPGLLSIPDDELD